MKTRVVNIGKIPLGGDYPVRIQSMTTTDTMDTAVTVEQTISLANVGCEYVRITAPSINEAKNLAEIKKELKKRGYDVPLIADIHYTPKAAEVAAQIVEKVRINPGNYVDKKKFQIKEYDDSEYQAELERIEQRFAPLVKICKENGTAMRIGANHGSLSDRIMSRYGDTPQGMVESALEFVKICEKYDYRDIVISMKASNTRVMVAAYRLLIQRMEELGMNYPIHLGVTEAGDGLDGRIKSAIGIGAFPGALPVLIGCVAFQGEITSLAFALFALQFFWQFPHFSAIGFLGFEDYQKAGFRFVASLNGKPHPNLGFQSMLYALCLIPVGLLPFINGYTGMGSAIVVVLASLVYAWMGWRLQTANDRKNAMQLMFSSFFYLPIVLLALWIDKI